jgi:3-hydroxymyristoyl/3-hydroxydecanoyl-(acyl carrier protein) dehydratase
MKEVGYRESAYCLADALMYADGKPIVEITDMSVRLTGLTKQAVDRLWQPTSSRARSTPILPRYDRRTPIFDTDRITAFAIGKPSEAFGDRYLPFDHERKIARLPGPPFQFLDRIVSIGNCQPWVLEPGGEIVAQYDVPPEAWYFASNRQPTMPFAVLLETALQPCGWLAAYLGSALTSDIDLSFRNLGGTAVQYRDVTPDSGTLTTTVKMTRVSNSAGMIIQHYDYDLRANGEPVYVGNTYFGFFSKSALANQIGIRDAKPYQPTSQELTQSQRGDYPVQAPFPDDQFRMIQSIESLSTTGGPYGHGSIVGTMPVDPSAWFFKAHFYQDPVVPGSLGLESFWQLLKVFAANRWKLGSNARFATPSMLAAAGTGSPPKHEWVYRGQVIPRDSLVTVSAVIRDVDDATRTLTGEGFLSVDGRVIYQMKNFILGWVQS